MTLNFGESGTTTAEDMGFETTGLEVDTTVDLEDRMLIEEATTVFFSKNPSVLEAHRSESFNFSALCFLINVLVYCSFPLFSFQSLLAAFVMSSFPILLLLKK